MSGFAFSLNDNVRISCSGETGLIVGRAEYSHYDNRYLIRYKAADGRAVEDWWPESALELVQSNETEKEVD